MNKFFKLLAKIRQTCLLSFIAVPALLLLASQCNTPPPPLPATATLPLLPVAILLPTDGELAPHGRAMQNGIQMAFDNWNRQGGAAGYQLQSVPYHTNCTFESAQQAAKQAVDDGHKFILGPLCAEAAIAAATEAQKAHVLMIAPAAPHPLVTNNTRGQPRPTVFQMSYDAQTQAIAAAKFAHNNLAKNKVATLFQPGNSYTLELIEIFERQFLAEGGKIVYRGSYSSGSPDYLDVLNESYQLGAEIIYLPAQAPVANKMAGQFNTLAMANTPAPLFLGSDAWESDQLDLVTTDGSYFPIHFTLTHASPTVKSWGETYKATYATAPDTLAALSYDAAMLLAQAINQTGSINPVAVAATIEQIKFSGVTGETTFNQQHTPLKPVPFVYIKNNQKILTDVLP